MTSQRMNATARLPWAEVAILFATACSDAAGPGAGAGGPMGLLPAASPAADTVRISGTGSIGTGSAVPGNDTRDFDLDVASTLGGRMFYRDWFVVRPDGSVGTIKVSPTDTTTRITAFRESSTACADPATGVEFDGIGRVNTGGDSDPSGDELLGFTVWACDGGPAGSGADYFAMIVPAHDYARGDAPTSGDLVKSHSGTPAPPPVATQLAFTVQPSTVTAGGIISPAVQVTAQDSAGNTATGFTGTVTVAIGANPTGGTLSGTTSVAAVDGVAMFSNLSVDRAGDGYRLSASASGLTGATSAPFTVTAPATTGDLVVTTSTAGSGLDPDGYVVTVDGSSFQAIPINGSVTFGSQSAATHTVLLSGVAANCSVDGGETRTATVPAGGTGTAAFAASCTAPDQPPAVDAGPDQTVLLGLLYTFNASFADPDNDGPWSYTINWGDGTSSSGTTASQGTISAGHSYLWPLSRRTITVTVTDSHGASGSDTKTVTVIL